MNDKEKDRLIVRIMVYKKALQEIVSISEISTGNAAAFYGLLARKALERGES